MLLSVLLSMLLAEDQLQKVIIQHLLTKESMRSFGTSLGLQDTRTVEFCSKPFFKSNIGYVKMYVPLNS